MERIQQRLIELGYMQGSATGTFDAATTGAVKAFQRVVGVQEDGVVDYALYTQLIADDAPAYGSAEADAIRQGGYTLLQEGASGEAVTRLQKPPCGAWLCQRHAQRPLCRRHGLCGEAVPARRRAGRDGH